MTVLTPTRHHADELLLGFARALRAAGVPVTQDRTRAYLEATALVGLDDQKATYWAGRATLCSGPDDLDRYDQVFTAWFLAADHPVSRPPRDERTVRQAALETGDGVGTETDDAPANGGADAPTAPAPEATAAENDISEEEGRELLQSIVDFTETLVKEVMTPRPDIVAVSVESTLQDLRTVFREEQYSRMPVYRESLDNVVGVVFVKDMVALPPGAEPPVTTLMRPPYLYPRASACRTC